MILSMNYKIGITILFSIIICIVFYKLYVKTKKYNLNINNYDYDYYDNDNYYYNDYNDNNSYNNDSYNNIENFSVLNKLKKNNKNNNKNNNKKHTIDKFDDTKNSNNDSNDESDNSIKELMKNSMKNSLKSLKSKKTGSTFDDLINASEKINPDKYTLENIRKTVADYSNSFKKEKFKNDSKSTAEAFEKFSLYKEKFFEIFK